MDFMGVDSVMYRKIWILLELLRDLLFIWIGFTIIWLRITRKQGEFELGTFFFFNKTWLLHTITHVRRQRNSGTNYLSLSLTIIYL